uniref:Uncharacterized protein n=1 Tax=Utricularia reniformis TaxID=192314 RepID=A0A1Y0B342_9LAMI|nr:hypothetical protein AEK19_MT1647 [Utricularia reniformis]ART31830.1 hypothetical protein AEK19_MT1647 [Utricularia reniformis]
MLTPFRTNQPPSQVFSAFWEQSMQQNRAMDLRRIPRTTHSFDFCAGIWPEIFFKFEIL